MGNHLTLSEIEEYKKLKKRMEEETVQVEFINPNYSVGDWVFGSSRTYKELTNVKDFTLLAPGLYFNRNNKFLYRIKEWM